MEKIIIGNKQDNINYQFRETCFGIVEINDEFYLTSKNNELSLIGGGLEQNEDHFECLKREFMEESGLTITSIKEFITIDCYWLTRDKINMNSLANFYIVTVSSQIKEPTENDSKLVKVPNNKIIDNLALPYQKKAIELYLKGKKTVD